LSVCGDRARAIGNQWLKARFDFVLCVSTDKHLTYRRPRGHRIDGYKPLFSNDYSSGLPAASSIGTGLALQHAGEKRKSRGIAIPRGCEGIHGAPSKPRVGFVLERPPVRSAACAPFQTAQWTSEKGKARREIRAGRAKQPIGGR
jgi:hypothetical protein